MLEDFFFFNFFESRIVGAKPKDKSKNKSKITCEKSPTVYLGRLTTSWDFLNTDFRGFFLF